MITIINPHIVSDDVPQPLPLARMASVKVAVRVRPFNGRERQLSSSLVVKMIGEQQA